MLPFKNSSIMEFESLLSSIKDTNEACVSLIGEDQRSQIRDLQIQNESLTNLLNIKDSELQAYKGKLNSIEEKIESIIEQLKNEADSDDKINELEDIETENYTATKIELIVSYLSENRNVVRKQYFEEEEEYTEEKVETENNEVISRLRAQLAGHIDFLTRLVQAPEYQGFFLISDQTGKTFLDSATKNLLLEQSRRTTQLLSTLPANDKYGNEFANIDDILGHKIDLIKRSSTLSKLLNKNNCSEEEIKDMLLQETVITSILTKSYETMKKIAEDNQKAAQSPTRYMSTERSTSRSPDAYDRAYEKKAKSVFKLLSKALNEDNDYSREAFLDSSKRIAQDYVNAQNTAGNTLSFTEYVDQTGSALRELSQRVREMKETMKNQQKTNNDNVWYPWARRVYAGILGIEAKPKDVKDMQIIIEESALTSCGNRQLQKRLESLRNQKKVMTQPKVQAPDAVRFKTLLAVSISLMRIRRSTTYRTPTHVRVSSFY